MVNLRERKLGNWEIGKIEIGSRELNYSIFLVSRFPISLPLHYAIFTRTNFLCAGIYRGFYDRADLGLPERQEDESEEFRGGVEGAYYDHYRDGDTFLHFEEYPHPLIFNVLETGEITRFDEYSISLDKSAYFSR